MKKLYCVWYETVTNASIVRHVIAQDVTLKQAREIKRAHQYRRFVFISESVKISVPVNGTHVNGKKD